MMDIYKYIEGDIYRYILGYIYRYMVGYLQIQGVQKDAIAISACLNVMYCAHLQTCYTFYFFEMDIYLGSFRAVGEATRSSKVRLF